MVVINCQGGFVMPQKRRKAARRQSATQERKGARVFPTLFRSVLLALPACVGAGLLLVLMLTALLAGSKDPDRYHSVAGILALYLTAAVGGALCTLFYRRRAPLLCGGTMGLSLFVSFTVLALFVPKSPTANQAISLLLRVPVIPASLIGAALSGRKKHRTVRRRHRQPQRTQFT
jgi:peptidoglycan/LPS O-acetylase OafA/YrhL